MFVISIVSISKFYDSLRYRIEQVSKREREREGERERERERETSQWIED